MDPWYYLDLETNIKDNDDDTLELNEICSMYPDGSWILDSEEYDGYIIFREKEYKSIEFNNNTKMLECVGENIIRTFTLIIA
jgi:hypothetical protein|tara:strand:- start:881 stop:1126 length:246 start_codon:yes stop_codon:yes gene_type:complete